MVPDDVAVFSQFYVIPPENLVLFLMCAKSQAPMPEVISCHRIFIYYSCFPLDTAFPHFLLLFPKLIVRHIVGAQ